jgi:hypothetical protein
MPRIRRTELHRRRVRRKKLAKLKDRYARAETEADQATIREKIAKIAPWVASELPAGERAVGRAPKMATLPVDTPVKKRASPARRSGSPGPAQAESKGTESAEGRG